MENENMSYEECCLATELQHEAAKRLEDARQWFAARIAEIDRREYVAAELTAGRNPYKPARLLCSACGDFIGSTQVLDIDPDEVVRADKCRPCINKAIVARINAASRK